MSVYDPDSRFSKGALSRLEAAGIPVLTSLKKVDKKNLAAAFRVQNTGDVLENWASAGNILSTRDRCPTWRTLYEVLSELDLEELSQEIEDYLSCE